MTDLDLSDAGSGTDLAAGVLASFDASLVGLRALDGERLEERLRACGAL